MKNARKVKGGEDFSALLNLAASESVTVAKAACYAGIGVLADAIKAEIYDLPTDEGYIREDAKGNIKRKRNVVSPWNQEMLARRLGISSIESTTDGASVVVSFAGYNGKPTKQYPNGLPIPLLARSIESGSSVREKNPFIRRAYNKGRGMAQSKAIDAGQKKLNEIIK